MKKAISVLFIVLLFFAGFSQEVKWFDGSFDEAKAEAKKTDKLILIDFFSGSG